MPGEDHAEVGDAFLEASFTQAPVGLFITDRDLRVVRFNRSREGVRGLADDAILGHRLEEFAPGMSSPELAETGEHILKTGETVRDRLFHGTRATDPARQVTVSVTGFRLSDASGRVLGLAAVIQEVTEREAALERLAIHNDANRIIGSTLDVVTTARELADIAVARFADRVMVDLVEEALRGERPPAGPRDAATKLRRVVDHHHVGKTAPEYTVPTHRGPSMEARAQHRPVLAEQDSVLVAPLLVQDELLGLATFVRSDRVDSFTAADVELAAALAGRTALSLDKALAYTRERDVATALQRHLLPREPPPLSAVECAYVNHSGAEAADWFDAVPLSGARVALVMGTVAGRSLETAATMGQLRTAVKTLAAQDLAPEELLARLDEATDRLAAQLEDAHHAGRTPGSFASCLYLIYDPTTRRCTAASAGHPGPIALRPDGRPIPFNVPVGPFLGQGGPFEATTLELPADTLLALHTTGRSPVSGTKTSANRERLIGVLTYPGPSLKQLCEAASALLPALPAEDRSLLLARTRVLGTDAVALWTLPPDPSMVSTARGLVRRQLEAWKLDELADTTELIASELVTNASATAAAR